VILVRIEPLAQNFDRMPRKANAVAFCATRGVISTPWCYRPTSSAVQGLDASEIAAFLAG
jgi:hypothetical protein